MSTLLHTTSPFAPIGTPLPSRTQQKEKLTTPRPIKIPQLTAEYRRIQEACWYCLLGAPQ